MDVRQGDIFKLKFGMTEAFKMRGKTLTYEEFEPVLVISNDVINRSSSKVIVLTITSHLRESKYPSHVPLKGCDYNLDADSVILGEHVRTVEKKRLEKKLSHLDDRTMREVAEAYSYNTFADANFFKKIDIKPNDYVKGKFISSVEDYDHEFKSVQLNQPFDEIRKKIKNWAIEYTCAFLNHGRGKLFIGIEDNGEITGFSLTNSQKDELSRAIDSALNDSIKPHVIPADYQMYFHPIKTELGEEVEERYVLQIQVNEPPDKSVVYYVGSFKIWTRLNGQTRKLEPWQITNFIERKTLLKYNIEN
ncbi:type II toxin-antitoxin system PemK/MazF family toxin [Streptomyces sp. ID01-9D]|uniref:type II toxin-antitoxin system PemK/MazF family toxin n=1 Tax=Streptomyces sp. ID01-9D TaxID=3028659 RepID=UPI0029C26C5B|nr:type II toxin-antitoxin system PemK/MazF family toxin [Streptomyces sp. ID01-9D]MDX5578442.1 type II toxin-antitoxin system PemK/MazF family toxin [Streptomyces sp. ID01-9D]